MIGMRRKTTGEDTTKTEMIATIGMTVETTSIETDIARESEIEKTDGGEIQTTEEEEITHRKEIVATETDHRDGIKIMIVMIR